VRSTVVASIFSLVSGLLVQLLVLPVAAQTVTPPPVPSLPLPADNPPGPDKKPEKPPEKKAEDTPKAEPAKAPPAPEPIPQAITPPPLLNPLTPSPPVVVADETEIPSSEGDRRRLVLPSQKGPVGLYRLSAADAGDPGQVRLGLAAEYGSADDFLIRGSRNRRLAGTLSVSGTPRRYIEVFGAILATANRNERCATGEPGCTPEADRVDPPTIRAFGDLVFGGKLAMPVLPWMGAGLEGGVRLFAANDGLSLDTDATSAWLTGLGSADLRENLDLPLMVHLNLGYYSDNSQNLQDFSTFRPSMLPSRLVTTFAYGMGSSRLRSGVGVSAPLDALAPTVSLEPFAEYHVELITGDPDPAYSAFMPPECDVPGATCIDNRDQQWASFGLRAQLQSGFTVTAGLDVTLRSVGFPYGPALMPWNFIIGIAQPFDFAPPPRTVTRKITLQRTVERPPTPKEGFVIGKVLNAQANEPIAGAVVSVVGHSKARVATDIDGSFSTKGLPPGPVKLEVSAPTFEPQVYEARVVIGKPTEIAAALRPALASPRVDGRVADATNRPLASARIRIVGPTSAELASDGGGRFSAELSPGSYVATIDAPGQAPQEHRFDLKAGVVHPLDVTLQRERGAAAVTSTAAAPVTYRDGRLTLRRPITFKIVDGAPSAEMVSGARTTLEALATLMNENPAISKLRVEAHWDSALGREEAEALTTQQAQSIVDFLVEKGVARDRLEAVGMGANKPRVPNLSPTVRAKNRRVEVTLVN
jgi:outer membrane protein OmpA-like peptidoglycan-associated protein